MEYQRPGGCLGDEATTGDWFAHRVYQPATIAQLAHQPVSHPHTARRLPEKSREIFGANAFGCREVLRSALAGGHRARFVARRSHRLASASGLRRGPSSAINGSLGAQLPAQQCKSASMTAAERNHCGR